MAKPMAILLGAVTLGALASGCDREESIVGLQPKGLNMSGNWEFGTTSMAPETSPATIAGTISQSDGLLTGAVHVNGSSCFDTLATIALSGALETDSSSISLTSAAVEGQVISIIGRATYDTLAGTYAISGGCADGDQGHVTGFRVRRLDGDWIVRLRGPSGGLDDYSPPERWTGQAMLVQGSANSDGSFGVSGTVSNACSGCSPLSGTISSGTFPSPSFVLGTSVVLEIETPNGTVAFRGTVKESGSKIVGRHQFVGGTHDGKSGSACFGRLDQVHGPCF
jgi:hypothetical protein